MRKGEEKEFRGETGCWMIAFLLFNTDWLGEWLRIFDDYILSCDGNALFLI